MARQRRRRNAGITARRASFRKDGVCPISTSKHTGHSHCASQQAQSACHSGGRVDYLLWGSLSIVAIAYLAHLLLHDTVTTIPYAGTFADSSYELMNRMWWGLALGILFVGLLGKIPREFVMKIIGRAGTISGVCRATLAGLMLDLCSHGILLVGMKLYERGASIGQVMAFLIASPWNSISLTIILISLVGLYWTLLFIAISAVIAILSGIIFDRLRKADILPANPNDLELPEDFRFWHEAKERFRQTRFDRAMFQEMASAGLSESRMILRWIFFGVVLASAIRTFLPPEQFQTYFGPTLAGLGLTLVVATILEVCSEGSTPIAADILKRADAPGNALAFLMSGVSTDYTEIMSLRETTRSWKIALFLPLVTVPQVVLVAWLLNQSQPIS